MKAFIKHHLAIHLFFLINVALHIKLPQPKTINKGHKVSSEYTNHYLKVLYFLEIKIHEA